MVRAPDDQIDPDDDDIIHHGRTPWAVILLAVLLAFGMGLYLAWLR